MSSPPNGPTPQTPRKKRTASIANDDYVPEQEPEQPPAKIKKTTTGEKKAAVAPTRERKTPAPKPKLGKLAKLYKAHQKVAIPIATKVDVKARNAVGVQKVSIGASIDSGPDPYKRRKIIEDAKQVDAKLAKEEARPGAKPKLEVETRIDENDPEVEIIRCPVAVRWVRITNKMHNEGGERALMSEIRKNPDRYPHITIEDGKDEQGRTVIRRRRMEPEVLEELRAAEEKRKKQAARIAGRERRKKDNGMLLPFV